MSGLVGHDVQWQEWRAAIDGGRMHHAWLLTGPSVLANHCQKSHCGWQRLRLGVPGAGALGVNSPSSVKR